MQILTNLVSNAIKFSPRGGVIHIRVEVVASGRVRFSVSDQGAGIAEAHRARLFSKFHQVDSSDSRGKGGTGLGLAISKAIVEQHGGEIGLHSRFFVGSDLILSKSVVRKGDVDHADSEQAAECGFKHRG